MNEPTTYYRIDEEAWTVKSRDWTRWMKEQGVLVPVVPCEHGNTNRHIVDSDHCLYTDETHEWCPGAAVGEDTP